MVPLLPITIDEEKKEGRHGLLVEEHDALNFLTGPTSQVLPGERARRGSCLALALEGQVRQQGKCQAAAFQCSSRPRLPNSSASEISTISCSNGQRQRACTTPP